MFGECRNYFVGGCKDRGRLTYMLNINRDYQQALISSFI